jgi:hypothetical protein
MRSACTPDFAAVQADSIPQVVMRVGAQSITAGAASSLLVFLQAEQ